VEQRWAGLRLKKKAISLIRWQVGFQRNEEAAGEAADLQVEITTEAVLLSASRRRPSGVATGRHKPRTSGKPCR
jgi:hypothetical protein